MEPNPITDQAGSGGGGASRRRPLLASLTTLGVVAGLLGVAGVFAAGSDTATTGVNDVESGEVELREADIQLATATMGLSDPEQHQTVECNDDWSDDLATGVLSGDVDQFEDYDFTMGVLCLRNAGTEAVDVAWSTFDVVDEELACSSGEEDGACGDVGELSQHLTIDLGHNLGEEPLCRVGTPTTPAAAQAPADLVTLEPGQTVGLCTHAIWDGDASSQSDRVLFRILFEALVDDGVPPGECRDDAFEENDSSATATPHPGDGELAAQMCAGDHDWFQFEHTGDELQIYVYNENAVDLDFDLVNASGLVVHEGRSPDSYEEFAAQIDPGTYYVDVFGYEDAESAYTIFMRTVELEEPPPCPDDAFEENDSIGQAVLVDDQVAGTICPGDDDFFAVEHEGGDLQVHLAFVHDVGDLDLQVFGPGGALVGESNGVSDSETVVVPADAASAGTYVVRVLGYQNAVGDYTLTIGQSIILPPPGGGEGLS
jgi:hypothetical protein